MDIFGIGLPELAILVVFAGIILLHGNVIARVWRREAGMIFKAIWTAIIVGAPFVGVGLYLFLAPEKAS